jgi:hypothetical protein
LETHPPILIVVAPEIKEIEKPRLLRSKANECSFMQKNRVDYKPWDYENWYLLSKPKMNI